MSMLFVLFEHASGYALFRVKEYEEVSMLTPQVEKSMLDVTRFKSVVQLVGFTPFKNAANALDNMNSISEGIIHEDLQLFLETNLPKSTKKEKVILGVGDVKIAQTLQETLGLACQHTGVVPEIIRGVRIHFQNLIKGLTPQSASKAQLGLGHSYSRAKVKFNVNRVDNMIIQSISLLDQLDKDINTFSMRIREWYSYHFPELVKIVTDNYSYAQAVKLIKNRKELTEDVLEKLEEIVKDSAKAQAIIDAARSSMGMDISPLDLMNIEMFASRVISLSQYRKSLMEYLKDKMQAVSPNLATLIGDSVGARLISHAGSLTNLAKYPASTVQILGAEKALFRALKTRGNTPKYGLIFHSTFIGRAGTKNKGRISRYLANKCSIAARIDCFSEIPTTVFGNKLREQVEERLQFYETGSVPRKNLEVMKEALEEFSVVRAEAERKRKKKLKKERKKQKLLEAEEAQKLLEAQKDDETLNDSVVHNGELDDTAVETPLKKKNKKKKKEKMNDGEINDSFVPDAEDQMVEEVPETLPKKKKKNKGLNNSEVANSFVEVQEEPTEMPDASAKKKKKKKHLNESSTIDSSQIADEGLDETPDAMVIKKKKKRKMQEMDVDGDDLEESVVADSEILLSPKKSKKKKKILE